MSFYYTLADGETQADASSSTRYSRRGLVEAIEDSVKFLRAYADSLVPYADHQIRVICLAFHCYFRVLGRVFDGVTEEVVQHLADAAGIGVNQR
jgi:hypothetical protein